MSPLVRTFLPAYSLWARELLRFLRQRTRMIGVIGSPILFWFFIGSGLGSSFRTAGSGGGDYLKFLFPGTLLLIMLFTGIFSTMSIIEDRKEGFLQAVLVAPISASGIVLGKVLGGATLAFVQALIFLILAPLAGIPLSLRGLLLLVPVLAMTGFSLTALGFMIAWRLDSTQGFHALMNLFLIPLWILSGSLFPIAGVPKWLEWIMRINPVTYAIEATRLAIFGQDPSSKISFSLAVGVLILFLVITFLGSLQALRRSAA